MKEARVIAGIKEKKSNGGTQWYQHERVYQGDITICVTTVCNPYYAFSRGGKKMEQLEDLAIRKLTPRECMRLMGVDEESIDRMSKNQSDASLYHLAGDSIVVDVLENIFKEMIEEEQ